MPRCQPPETARERLREWYRQVPGSLLLEAERCAVHGVLSELMGYRVAQVGSLGNDNLLCKSRMPHRMIVDADGHSQGVAADLYARADALPLQSSSLDAMLLPHTLEFEEDPHQVLREAHRALIAEGHVIIIGFNPWGLWGLWRLARRRSGDPPWCGSFLHSAKLHDWLSLLGFQVLLTRFFFFRPPLRSERLLHRLSFMEARWDRWWLPLGGCYLVVAEKRVVPLTPIRLRWRVPHQVTRIRWAEPTARGTRHGK